MKTMQTLLIVMAVSVLCVGCVTSEQTTVGGLPESQPNVENVTPQFTEDGYQLGVGLPEYQRAVESGEINSLEWQDRIRADMSAGGADE